MSDDNDGVIEALVYAAEDLPPGWWTVLIFLVALGLYAYSHCQ